MLIHVAENGKSFELDCQAGTTVDIVYNTLASLTGVPVSEQMLICGDTRLEASHALEYYKLPSDDRQVFLFNRARLVADAPSPLPEEIEIDEPQTVPETVEHTEHPLDRALNPLMRTLPQYERQFNVHLQHGQAVWRSSQQKFDKCRCLLQELQVQELSIETARTNIDVYYDHLLGSYSHFINQFKRKHGYHAELLTNFERDMDRLRLCELHPAVRTENRRTLVDCIKETGIRKWAEDSKVSHKQFGAKVSELKTVFGELQRSVEELIRTAPDVDICQLERSIDDSQKYLEEQASILQSLSKDLMTVKRLVEETVASSSQMSTSQVSMRPLDAVAALDPMSDVHTSSHIPRVEVCDRKLAQLLMYMVKCKNAMSRCVHTKLQSVAALQSKIRDMKNQLVVYKEALGRQEEMFAELVLVRRVGSAYKACLAEVVRRKNYAKLYMGQARTLAEKMAHIRNVEVARREDFFRQQSCYMLPEVLEGMGLKDVPSQCEVTVPAFDTHLLDLDVNDLQAIRAESPGLPISGSGADSLTKRSVSSSGEARGGSFPGQAGPSHNSESGISSSSGGYSRRDGDTRLHTELGRSENVEEGEMDQQPTLAGHNMELENAWLTAELASAVAELYAVKAELGSSRAVGDNSTAGISKGAADKLAEALRCKDEHTKQLQDALAQQQAQCSSYEKRIHDLEACLAEQHARNISRSGGGSFTSPPGTLVAKDGIGAAEVVTYSQEMPAVDVGSEGKDGLGLGDDARGESLRPLQDKPSGVEKDVLMTEAMPAGSMLGSASCPDTTMEEVPKKGLAEVETSELVMHGVIDDDRVGQSPSAACKEDAAGAGSSPNNVTPKHGPFPSGVGGASPLLPYGKGFGDLTGLLSSGSDKKTSEGEIEDSSSHGTLAAWSERESRLLALEEGRRAACLAAEEKVKAALAEVAELRAELDRNADLLSQCEVNCSFLESKLHEATEEARTHQEEARTHQVAAERRAAEYSALRTSSVRLRSLMERLSRCLTSPAAASSATFLESLRSLASSLQSSETAEDNGENLDWFKIAMQSLAEKVSGLVTQRADLLERCNAAESHNALLRRQLDNAVEMQKALAVKHDHAVQVAQNKLAFLSFDAQDLAIFMSNTRGHYEAINYSCPNVFLSPESLASVSTRGMDTCKYVIGRITRMERRVAGGEGASGGDSSTVSSVSGRSGNFGENRGDVCPYGLDEGTEYSVVSVSLFRPRVSP